HDFGEWRAAAVDAHPTRRGSQPGTLLTDESTERFWNMGVGSVSSPWESRRLAAATERSGCQAQRVADESDCCRLALGRLGVSMACARNRTKLMWHRKFC